MNIITECKDCIFAKNKQDYISKGTDQLDCLAGRLDVFEEIGRSTYCWNQDEKKGYYKINGICNLKTVNKPAEQSLTDALDYAKFRINNIFDLIIYVNDKNAGLLKDTVKSVYNQGIDLHKMRVLVNSKKYTKIDKTLLSNYIVHRLPQKEKILGSLDVVLGQIDPSIYYCFVESGTELPPNALANVAYYMNEMCLPLYCVYSPTFLVCSTYFHKLLNGSFGMNLFKKIKKLYYSDDNNKKFILSYEELNEKVTSNISRRNKQTNEDTVPKNIV